MDITGILNSIVNSLASGVGNAIGGVLSSVEQDAQKYVFQPVSNDIGSALSAVGDSLDSIETAASKGINTTLSTVGNALASAESSVAAGFNSVVSGVSSTLSQLGSSLGQAFNAVVNGVSSGFTALENGVTGEFEFLANTLETGFSQMGQQILAGLTANFGPVVSFIEGLPEDITKIASEIGDAIGGLAKQAEAQAESIAKFVDSHAGLAIADVQKALDPATWVGARDLFGNTFFDLIGAVTGLDISKADPLALGRLAAGLYGEFIAATAVPFDEGLAFMMGRQLPAILDVAMSGSWRDLEQMSNGATPNTLLHMGELVTGLYRGTIDKSYFYDQMQRHGISNVNADVMYQNGATLLGVGELVQLYYRGTITSTDDLYKQAQLVRAGKSQVDAMLTLAQPLIGISDAVTLWRRNILPDGWVDYFDDARKAGMTEERIDALKASSYRIPTPSEQKQFIVRDVDNDATAQKYGYDTDFQQSYVDAMVANGFDATTAKRFFRASWQVPPFFITEGLYRTGKLDAATFKQLLLIEGYSPYWADEFIAQLTPTLTSADIKDLYKYQVITADEIPAHLEAIGMPVALATQYQQLWQASVKLTTANDQSGSAAEAAAAKGETEGLIKTAYEDGVLTRDEANTHLLDLGKTQEAATLILEIADYNVTQKKVKDAFTLAKDQYLNGAISMTDALQALITAGASNSQVTLYQDQLTKAGASKPKLPSMAEFGAWFKKGIITAVQLAEGLSLLGYSDTWVPYFMIYFGAAAADLSAAGFDPGTYNLTA